MEFAASVRSAANVTPANAPTTRAARVARARTRPRCTPSPRRRIRPASRSRDAARSPPSALTVPTNANSGVSVTPQSPSASPLDTAFPFASLACSVATDATPATPPKSAAPRARTTPTRCRRRRSRELLVAIHNRRPLETHRDRVRAHGSRGELDVVTSVGFVLDESKRDGVPRDGRAVQGHVDARAASRRDVLAVARITLGVALGVARDDSRGDSRPRGGGRETPGKRPSRTWTRTSRRDTPSRSRATIRGGGARGGFHPRLVLARTPSRVLDGVRPVALVHHDVRARGGGASSERASVSAVPEPNVGVSVTTSAAPPASGRPVEVGGVDDRTTPRPNGGDA